MFLICCQNKISLHFSLQKSQIFLRLFLSQTSFILFSIELITQHLLVSLLSKLIYTHKLRSMPSKWHVLFYVYILDLLRCTEEPNVSIPTLANLLLERTQNQNWIVVFKSLVTIHHLMCYGNEVALINDYCKKLCQNFN